MGQVIMQKLDPRLYSLVFDIGGVLVDWNPRYLYHAFFDGDPRSMEDFFHAVDFWKWNEELDRGRPFSEAVAELSVRFPQYTRLIKAFDERWVESVGGPIQGSLQIVRTLEAAGIPLYGLTNSSKEKFRILLKKYTFLEHFRWIMISGEFGVIKPDPRIFELFLDRTGLRNEECIFIDDSEANVSSAVRMGWKAILFRSPDQLALELDKIGLKVGSEAVHNAGRKELL
jgi:2-haloacid dehalogenase